LRWLIFLFPIALLALFVWLKTGHGDFYATLVREDGLVENLQFALFLLSGILAGVLAVRLWRTGLKPHAWLYWLLSAGLLVVAFDEISWGQRLFGLETPEGIEARNLQGELTVHNLEPIMIYLHTAYLLVGAFGMLAWLARRILARDRRSLWAFVLPEWFLSTWFAMLLLVYGLIELAQWVQPTVFGHRLVIGEFIVFRDQEPAELALAGAMLVFVLDRFRALDRLAVAGRLGNSR